MQDSTTTKHNSSSNPFATIR